MCIEIRNVTSLDLDQVTEVEATCFPPAEAASREEFQKRIETFPQSFYVAVHPRGQIVGFINGASTDQRVIADAMYHDNRLHNPQGAYQCVFGLDVLPDYQHRGIAAQLMKHLIEQSKLQGKKGVILTCKDRLIHYYESFGYVNTGKSQSNHGGAVWYDMVLDIN